MKFTVFAPLFLVTLASQAEVGIVSASAGPEKSLIQVAEMLNVVPWKPQTVMLWLQAVGRCYTPINSQCNSWWIVLQEAVHSFFAEFHSAPLDLSLTLLLPLISSKEIHRLIMDKCWFQQKLLSFNWLIYPSISATSPSCHMNGLIMWLGNNVMQSTDKNVIWRSYKLMYLINLVGFIPLAFPSYWILL